MKDGFLDMYQGALRWRAWHLMGVGPLRQRYARSYLGQYWIVLGTLITVTAFGLLWSQLWRLPIQEFIPYVAVAHIGWSMVTGPLQDSIGSLQSNSYYFVNQKAPLTTVFIANYYRNLIVFLHNLLVVLAVLLWFQVNPGPSVFLVIPGLLINAVVAINLGVLIGLVCARYRDMQQVVGNLLQVLYFFTPVMWKPELLPDYARWIADYNPFAQLLALIRDPLLGRPADPLSWAVAGMLAVILALITPWFLSKFSKQAVYWI